MEKDPRLINIYLKIHNKRCLTMDDLQYLALYSPECFEKTCKNVVYNFPNAKTVMEPENVEKADIPDSNVANLPAVKFDSPAVDYGKIQQILQRLHQLEADELPQTGVKAEDVKNLLGNLYMELIFPHNDQLSTLWMPETETHTVDFRA